VNMLWLLHLLAHRLHGLSSQTEYVTGSVKRDLNLLFKMRVLQRSVFPQRYAQSKSNTVVLRRRRSCSNDAEMMS